MREGAIMITADYFVECLLKMAGNTQGIHGIEWSYDPESYLSGSGFRAIVRGVGLYLHEYHTATGMGLSLVLLYDKEKTRIVAPDIHISRTPIGKFLRGLALLSKDPLKPEECAKERLRVALWKLYALADEQYEARENKRAMPVGAELREAIQKGMFRRELFMGVFDNSEEVRQRLFRKVLGYDR
jgi:hypothetical protein